MRIVTHRLQYRTRLLELLVYRVFTPVAPYQVPAPRFTEAQHLITRNHIPEFQLCNLRRERQRLCPLLPILSLGIHDHSQRSGVDEPGRDNDGHGVWATEYGGDWFAEDCADNGVDEQFWDGREVYDL